LNVSFLLAQEGLNRIGEEFLSIKHFPGVGFFRPILMFVITIVHQRNKLCDGKSNRGLFVIITH